jgi:hypothetical protein
VAWRQNENCSSQLVARDFLDEFDDASPQPLLFYLQERLGEPSPSVVAGNSDT